MGMAGQVSGSESSYSSTFDLRGKVSIVTGGMGLLGKEFCKGLAEFGSEIAIIDIRNVDSEQFCAQLKEKYSTRVLFFECDISNPIQVSSAVNSIVNIFGKVDILVNNASTKTANPEKFSLPFSSFDLETWKEVNATNIDGMFLVAQAVGDHMIIQRSGSVIQISSIYGINAPDHRIYEGSELNGQPIGSPAVYTTSKAAVIGLTKYLATYWSKHNIRVNSITPGGVSFGQNTIFQEKYSERVPLSRMAESEEIVGGVLYLASNASSYVTGHNLVIDGGLSAW